MSIWKTPDVKPDGKDTYIAITQDGLICAFVSPKMCDDSIDRWAYLSDIVTAADRAERLQKAVEWLVGGDTGISSKTMCAALFGVTPKDSDMPHDADDFGRCLRFIRFMPDGTKDIVFEKLSDKPEWVEIGNRWDELVELYDQENWRGIYDILSAIRKEYRQPRPNEIFIGL